MRRKTLFPVVLCFTIIVGAVGASACSAQQLALDKALFNPDVVTIWHRLGVPQTRGRWRRWRDSRVNRDGLKPGRERKPPLLRLADPANLAEGAPEMLKAAAKIKIDQDLAPQKIKALRYICSVGCSCYNKQAGGMVDKAIMEGLADCTVDVRLAAIQVVIANAGNKCSTGGQCETCCSEELLKKLKEIAYKVDDKGCFIEPNERVRAKAEEALYACPELKEEEQKDDDKQEVIRPEGSKTKILRDGESEQSVLDEDTAANRSSRRGLSPYQQVSTSKSAWNDPALDDLAIKGTVESKTGENNDVLITFDKPYEFPIGSEIVIAIDELHVSYGAIIVSDTGKALIHIDDAALAESLEKQTQIRMGVLEN